MKWWGWLALAIAFSVAWAGVCSIGVALDWWSGSGEESAMYGGWIIVWSLCIGTPIILKAARRT